MSSHGLGAVLLGVGLAIAAIGLLVMTGALDWFGRLPGDIRIEAGKTRIYIPITSMILLSLVLSIVVHLVRRLLG